RGWAEKLFCSKFFMPVRLPTCADKCRNGEWIPGDLRGAVSPHRLVWTSEAAALPENDAVPPGRYWFKANPASRMNRRIAYPVRPEERAELEALGRQWLSHPFGLDLGEWWYATIPRRLLLCVDLSEAALPPANYNFIVANGILRLIGIDQRDETQKA